MARDRFRLVYRIFTMWNVSLCSELCKFPLAVGTNDAIIRRSRHLRLHPIYDTHIATFLLNMLHLPGNLYLHLELLGFLSPSRTFARIRLFVLKLQTVDFGFHCTSGLMFEYFALFKICVAVATRELVFGLFWSRYDWIFVLLLCEKILVEFSVL